MIKGNIKNYLWILQGLLVLWIGIAFWTKHPIAAVFPTIIFLANFMLIGAGSRADKMFFLYPYGAFILLYGAGFYLLFYYWKLYHGIAPKTLWFGMHPGSAIIWAGFGLIGGILITILSYTILFEKNVLSQEDWEKFIEDVQQFKAQNKEEITM
ncbi:hypothetical protein [Desulfotomaculum copahuensis]|uniref:Uncharacterized protein n=1 Tax=Desulfotomaculum copahuensis TaxID=1838280 RepID=A0A1B7LHC4_9FIRM|nr:hypothetical protein [Desulfotomaculum copahuensis]OAT85596.1 hypothetical protein A6M21_05635 [Desulfotomaculum copahuensis]